MEREEHLFEELCKKGKAYRAKRMAAGEKSSAYLSGRAVKVCKGQMKSEGEEYTAEDQWGDFNDEEKAEVLDALGKDGYNIIKLQDYVGYDEVLDDIMKGDNKTFDAAILGTDPVYEEIDALHENEEYCPKCATKIKEAIREEVKKVAKEAKTKPAKGKRFAKKVKNPKTGRTRTVSYGQAGKAKKGGDRIRPGTTKGHAYCARSAKIKKCKNPPCANTLSRKKWKCQGSRSVK